MPTKLSADPEFVKKVVWSPADRPLFPLCGYCHGALPKVPLMLWTDEGACASFCDKCAARGFKFE